MSTFIAQRIMEAYDKSAEEGKAKYRAYFGVKLYKKWQEDVDSILKVEGYEDVISA